MCARDQSSIFSTCGKFHPDYGLLLELHAVSLVARSFVLLLTAILLLSALLIKDYELASIDLIVPVVFDL